MTCVVVFRFLDTNGNRKMHNFHPQVPQTFGVSLTIIVRNSLRFCTLLVRDPYAILMAEGGREKVEKWFWKNGVWYLKLFGHEEDVRREGQITEREGSKWYYSKNFWSVVGQFYAGKDNMYNQN